MIVTLNWLSCTLFQTWKPNGMATLLEVLQELSECLTPDKVTTSKARREIYGGRYLTQAQTKWLRDVYYQAFPTVSRANFYAPISGTLYEDEWYEVTWSLFGSHRATLEVSKRYKMRYEDYMDLANFHLSQAFYFLRRDVDLEAQSKDHARKGLEAYNAALAVWKGQ